MLDTLFFDDFTVGQKFVSKGRTVTEADVVNFSDLTWDHNSLHTDEEYAKDSRFGRRIAHGILGIAMHAGLTSYLTADSIVALMGLNWKFKKPIFIGDTIHVEQTVKEMRPLPDGARGVLTFAKDVVNQDGEIVQQGEVTVLLAMKSKQ
ncbi:MAG: MaoC family dehydratase N-terminal domain-containing protein [Desulfarculaceae bacterium]|nr:MaoC family dehydratase N-terminal domain-containing protein [Desulfarculaceae bacterium]MCF8073141.1 MaoC family dehydratase N-terminal domain-containing protein [Desulfarculaceae bacterium]MCF8101774.1 MaoC family dehydratase N-terminal domain-containing protein [Desulfarculaceae bacterium]MCF8117338.1 MaoC family dehydratase N-terminal domain-containing protein [Desulfarculaceae bacterium]